MKNELILERKELREYLNVNDGILKAIIRRKQLEDRIHIANRHYILSDIIEILMKNNMEEELRLDKKELCKYLNVKNSGIKTIINKKQLEDRIHMVDKHYILSDVIETPGKPTIYVLKYIECETFKQFQSRFKIKNKEVHKKYVIERIKDPRLSRTELIKICEYDITYYIAYTYDKILKDEGFIEEDGYEYRLWRPRGESERITEEEYRKFWYKNRYANSMISKYVKLYQKGKISSDEFEKHYYEVQEQYPEMDGFAYRFTAYRNLKDDTEETLNWIGPLIDEPIQLLTT